MVELGTPGFQGDWLINYTMPAPVILQVRIPRPGHEVIKLFSCSTQLSTKFQLLIKTKIPTNEEASCFKSLRCCIYHTYNVKMPTLMRFLSSDKFRAQLI